MQPVHIRVYKLPGFSCEDFDKSLDATATFFLSLRTARFQYKYKQRNSAFRKFSPYANHSIHNTEPV